MIKIPYIKQDRRNKFDHLIDDLYGGIKTDGELTYIIYKLCLLNIKRKGICYDSFKDIIGVLGCIQSEIYRRHIVTYENDKIFNNSDVIV